MAGQPGLHAADLPGPGWFSAHSGRPDLPRNADLSPDAVLDQAAVGLSGRDGARGDPLYPAARPVRPGRGRVRAQPGAHSQPRGDDGDLLQRARGTGRRAPPLARRVLPGRHRSRPAHHRPGAELQSAGRLPSRRSARPIRAARARRRGLPRLAPERAAARQRLLFGALGRRLVHELRDRAGAGRPPPPSGPQHARGDRLRARGHGDAQPHRRARLGRGARGLRAVRARPAGGQAVLAGARRRRRDARARPRLAARDPRSLSPLPHARHVDLLPPQRTADPALGIARPLPVRLPSRPDRLHRQPALLHQLGPAARRPTSTTRC